MRPPHYQDVLNSSISYLQHASVYIGEILTNVTNEEVYNNVSYAYSRFRKAVYEAYENVTAVNDVMNLANNSHHGSQNSEYDSYEDITIDIVNDFVKIHK